MINTAEIMNDGFMCLVENMGVINAEHFISLVKSDDFNYTIWQRQYFDKLPAGEFGKSAADYAKGHPYNGQGKII